MISYSRKGLLIRHGLNLVDRIFGSRTSLRELAKGHTVKRIHCSASKRGDVRGIRPFLCRFCSVSVTVYRGNGLIGTGSLQHGLRRGNTVFRSASSARILVRLVEHDRGSDLVRGVGRDLGRIGNNFACVLLARRGVFNTISPGSFHPLIVNRLPGNTCIVTDRAYTVSAVNTSFIHGIGTNRLTVVSSGNLAVRGCASSAAVSVTTVRCVCFTHPSSGVTNIGIRATHGQVKAHLTVRTPTIATSVIVNIPGSSLSTTDKFTRRDKAPCRVNLVGGRCIKHAFVRPARRLHRLNMGVGLSTMGKIIRNGDIIVISSSVIHKAADGHVIALLGRTKTGRIRIHVSSPPLVCPDFCNVSVDGSTRLVTTGVAISRVYTCVNTSDLTFLDRRNLVSSVNLGFSVPCSNLYVSDFGKSCPAKLCSCRTSCIGGVATVRGRGLGKKRT